MGMIIINNSYYIFLDIDGVLNRERDWKRGLYSLNAECVNFFLAYLEKLKIREWYLYQLGEMAME